MIPTIRQPPPGMNFTPINPRDWGRFAPESGFARVSSRGMEPARPGEETDVFYGNTPPGEGWSVAGQAQLPRSNPYGEGGRDGRAMGIGSAPTGTLIWRRGGGAGGNQAATAADALTIPRPSAPDQTALNNQLAANQAAIDQARAAYASQGDEMANTVRDLQAMLLRVREESAAALERQQQAFNTLLLTNSERLAASRATMEEQMARQVIGLPTPERGAVAPRLGDARTGGRNAAANMLSRLRIVSPGLLGGQPTSGSLGALQIA